MTNLKKFLAGMLAATMTMSLAACGAKPDTAPAADAGTKTDAAAATTTPADATAAKALTGGGSNVIYIITPSHSNPFFKT